MKAINPCFFLSLLTFLTLFPFGSLAWPSFPEESLTARSAFLVDAASGTVLYEREPDLSLPPASTTKIMTAIVALESKKKGDDLFRVTRGATRVPSSKLHLRPGQRMSLEDLLYSVLLSSANDASLVVAEGIGGSVERFAEMMTAKARAIGATNTQFKNPHGLTAPGHYSTARDLALIFSYAMKNPTFREIVQTKTASVKSFLPGKKRGRRVRRISVRNHNRLLWNFDGAIGGKTGYTYAAQKCFVGGVTHNGRTLIVAMLGSRDLWGDTRRLLEYGIEQVETLTLTSARPNPDGGLRTRPDKPSPALHNGHEEEEPSSSNGYVLQVASFRERERAESFQKLFFDNGYRSYLEAALINNGETAYRVRIGPYPEIEQAQEALEEIENKSGYRAIILTAPMPAEHANGS